MGRIVHTFRKLLNGNHNIQLPVYRDREAYIPLHTTDLLELLAPLAVARGHDEQEFRKVGRLILSLFHQRFRKIHERLTYRFAVLDPDRDRLEERPLDDTDRDLLARWFFDDLVPLLERANYHRLTPRQIQLATGASSHWGVRLNVQFSMFRRLEVYARGDIIGKRSRIRWYRPWRREEVDVPIYQRLVVFFRLKPGNTFQENFHPRRVHLRMFKNIPKFDVDMLLPSSGVRLSWIDRGKISLPSMWGLWRLVRTAWVFAFLSFMKVFASLVFTILILLAIVIFAIKSFLSYMTAKRRYLLNVAQSLYYQSLGSNMSVLLRLLEEAEQQESAEAILGYFVLSQPSESQRMSIPEWDAACEKLLDTLTSDRVDFDVDDAVRDLAGLGIVQCDDLGWSALPFNLAIEALQKRWNDI